MKKSLLVLLILFVQISFGQSPQSFKYQAVVRDAAGGLAVNKIISIKSSILLGSPTGSSVYTETQSLSTNDFGVVSLNIGSGAVVSGTFSAISWGAGTYFVKTELDINGGSTYVFMGTSQMLSVPYALYAEKTGSSVSDFDTSPTNEIQTLSVTGNSLSISGANTIALPPDADSNPVNELQTLSVNGYSISVSNGNTIIIPKDTLSVIGQSLFISNGNSVLLPPDSDSNPLNELQTLSILGDSLHISNSNSVYLSGAIDLDASPTNELQNLIITADTIKITNGNSVILPHDNDNDSINEIQTLLLNQGTLKLSKSNYIHLPDSLNTNELQNLNISNDTLTISNGNSIYLNTSKSALFPEGTDGIPFTLVTNSNTNFTVPIGENLWLFSYNTNTSQYNQIKAVFAEGTTVQFCCDYNYGVLVKKTNNIQIVNFTINSNGLTYTVPSGKHLYIIGSSYNGVEVNINGITKNIGITSHSPLILPPNTVLSINPQSFAGNEMYFGYLK